MQNVRLPRALLIGQLCNVYHQQSRGRVQSEAGPAHDKTGNGGIFMKKEKYRMRKLVFHFDAHNAVPMRAAEVRKRRLEGQRIHDHWLRARLVGAAT